MFQLYFSAVRAVYAVRAVRYFVTPRVRRTVMGPYRVRSKVRVSI